MHRGILILDYGSQFTQLIARRIRELEVFCDIQPPDRSMEWIRKRNPQGIILSGGPSSVYDQDAPKLNSSVLDLDVPVLGVCYGMQLIAQAVGGVVTESVKREYGRIPLVLQTADSLFEGFQAHEPIDVWMSHGDTIERLPDDFEVLASSRNAPIAAFAAAGRGLFGVQFHPEVVHTTRGSEMLRNFVLGICQADPDWTSGHFVTEHVELVRDMVGAEEQVICGLSGGVDSAVAAALVHRAIGDQLTCIFVDHGLLRRGERQQVEQAFRGVLGARLVVVDAAERFLRQLDGIVDPEEKRRRIGHTFIDVFEEAANGVDGHVAYLVQGTLYPDVIESVSPRGGPSATIKTHHNVGGLRDNLPFALIEPLRELFKDEVRRVGRELGLPDEIVGRHPFPGPGLAIRIIGEVTRERVDVLQAADEIYLDGIRESGLYDEIWQAFAVLLPVQSVGVMGDHRTYENVVALRAVTSTDGMTADWYPFPPDVIGRIANRIINEVSGVNRVVYDVSSKPPATIEWE